MDQPRNVVSSRGGKVHAPNLYHLDRSEAAFPGCRTGSQNLAGSVYRFTDQPVTCRACGGNDVSV